MISLGQGMYELLVEEISNRASRAEILKLGLSIPTVKCMIELRKIMYNYGHTCILRITDTETKSLGYLIGAKCSSCNSTFIYANELFTSKISHIQEPFKWVIFPPDAIKTCEEIKMNEALE